MPYAVQQAIVTKLLADSGVKAVLGNPARLYDGVPSNVAYPYAVVDGFSAVPFDTKNTHGWDCEITFNIWSEYRGRYTCEAVQAAFMAALHNQSLTVSGWTTVLIQHIQSESALAGDDTTRRLGITKFRVIIDQ